jgi:hypothetical protein
LHELVPGTVAPREPTHLHAELDPEKAHGVRIARDDLKHEAGVSGEDIVQGEKRAVAGEYESDRVGGDLGCPAGPNIGERLGRTEIVMERASQLIVPTGNVPRLVTNLVYCRGGFVQIVPDDLDRGSGTDGPAIPEAQAGLENRCAKSLVDVGKGDRSLVTDRLEYCRHAALGERIQRAQQRSLHRVGSGVDSIGVEVYGRLGAEILTAKGEQLASNRLEVAFTLGSRERGAQRTAPSGGSLDHTAQVVPQRDTEVLLEIPPRLGSRKVLESSEPDRGVRPVVDLAREMALQVRHVTHG